MRENVAVARAGHPTWLKWHRGRKRAGDIPFTAARLLEGLQAGASVEVDLLRHAEGGFAVLHDEVLDHETTGAGRVDVHTRAALRQLSLRDGEGRPSPHPVLLLEDLTQLLAQPGAMAPGALLQLDFKESAKVLGPGEIAGFAAAVAPVAGQMILSSGDAEAVATLTEAVPGLRIGYDPCHFGAFDALRANRDFSGFLAGAVAASPKAEMLYLEIRLVLFAAEAGFDLIAACHAAGRRVDAYTLETSNAAAVQIAERLLDLAVDQITTDDPAGLYAALIKS